MSDTTGEHSKALQFLRLTKRRFRLLALRDVAHDHSELATLALTRCSQDAADQKVAPVLPDMPALIFGPAFAGGRLQLSLGHATLNILWSEDPGEMLTQDLAFGVA